MHVVEFFTRSFLDMEPSEVFFSLLVVIIVGSVTTIAAKVKKRKSV